MHLSKQNLAVFDYIVRGIRFNRGVSEAFLEVLLILRVRNQVLILVRIIAFHAELGQRIKFVGVVECHTVYIVSTFTR